MLFRSLQVSAEEVAHVPGHEGRKADMSPAAGAAMRAVLAEMGREGSQHEASFFTLTLALTRTCTRTRARTRTHTLTLTLTRTPTPTLTLTLTRTLTRTLGG